MAASGLTTDLDGSPEERQEGAGNFEIGTRLLCENEMVRVWETIIGPGQRCRFHKHLTNYMWFIHEPAEMRVRSTDGETRFYSHVAGELTFIQVGAEPELVHDLTNVDDHEFRATLVEFKNNDVAVWRPAVWHSNGQ